MFVIVIFSPEYVCNYWDWKANIYYFGIYFPNLLLYPLHFLASTAQEVYSLQVHLIEGIVDQVEGTVYISWVQPRVLGIPQIKSLNNRLDSWVGKVRTALSTVEAETPDLLGLDIA